MDRIKKVAIYKEEGWFYFSGKCQEKYKELTGMEYKFWTDETVEDRSDPFLIEAIEHCIVNGYDKCIYGIEIVEIPECLCHHKYCKIKTHGRMFESLKFDVSQYKLDKIAEFDISPAIKSIINLNLDYSKNGFELS